MCARLFVRAQADVRRHAREVETLTSKLRDEEVLAGSRGLEVEKLSKALSEAQAELREVREASVREIEEVTAKVRCGGGRNACACPFV